jgi:hypothetical protein
LGLPRPWRGWPSPTLAAEIANGRLAIMAIIVKLPGYLFPTVGLKFAGAGDQGIMFGYASDETEDCMPLIHSMAARLGKVLTELRKSGLPKGRKLPGSRGRKLPGSRGSKLPGSREVSCPEVGQGPREG